MNGTERGQPRHVQLAEVPVNLQKVTLRLYPSKIIYTNEGSGPCFILNT